MKSHTEKAVLILITCLLTIHVQAGLLDIFEKRSTSKPPKETKAHASGTKKKNSVSGDIASAMMEPCVTEVGGIFFACMTYGTIESLERAYTKLFEPENADGIKVGEPLIPFARADVSYRYVNSSIDAIDYRLEGGFGPFATEFNHSIYDEVLLDGSKDRLDIKRINGLYRMYFEPFVEVDFGIGALTVDGDRKNTGLSFSLPVLIHFSEHAGVEFRPAWANVGGSNTSEYDIGLLFSLRHASIKTGYRTMKAEGMSLNGPYGGISFRF